MKMRMPSPVPQRPSTVQCFPKRPPTEILLSPRRKTELLLSKAQSRALINPNSIIGEQTAPITQTFYYKRQEERKTMRYKMYDEDARFIDYMRKQLERDRELADSTLLSQVEYNSKFGPPVPSLAEFEETAHLRNPHAAVSRNVESRYAKMEEEQWVAQVAGVEQDFARFRSYRKLHAEIAQNGEREKREKLESPVREAKTPSRSTPSLNKFGSCGVGRTCAFCGQTIHCRAYVAFYEYTGERVCCGCGEYIK